MTVSSQGGQGAQGSSEGANSLVTYNPSLFELTDEGNLMGPPASVGKQSRESTPHSGDIVICHSSFICTMIYSIPLCRFSL